MTARTSETAAARPSPLVSLWQGLRRMPAGNIIIVFILVQIVLVVFGTVFPDDFRYLSRPNILIMLRAIPTLGIMALGVGLLMIAGEFDLSVGSVVGLTTYILAITYNSQEWPLFASLALALAAGLSVGLVNGLITVIAGIPSFITTLGTMLIVRGLVRWVSGMDTERFNPGALFQSVTVGKLGVMQAQFVWFLGLALLAWYILHRTKLGNHIYASGGNKAAAIATGVNVDRVKLICFMLASTAATIAGVLSLTRVHSVTPAQDLGVELKVIAMCVIGGLALMGGRGTIIGIFIGACLFYTVEDVLLLIRAPGHFLDLFIGCVIVVAVIMNTWAARREDRW